MRGLKSKNSGRYNKYHSRNQFLNCGRWWVRYQNSGLLTSDLAGLGLILAGDLMINLAEVQVIYGAGDEFFIPAQTYYQATGGEFGTQFLFAKQRLGFD
jgi:hypothetical protein